MLRIWMIAGIALAASTGPTGGQDAAAGEQVFKRLCPPCHEIGPDAKIDYRRYWRLRARETFTVLRTSAARSREA